MAMGQQQYVRAVEKSANLCPRCGGHEIEGNEITVEGATCFQDVHCKACGYEWADDYRLTGYTEVDGPADDETNVPPEVAAEVDTAFFIVRGHVPGDSSDEEIALVLELPKDSNFQAVHKAFGNEVHGARKTEVRHEEDIYVSSIMRTDTKPVEIS